MPLFSIVIPCRAEADLLPATLAALRAQTCAEWEAICVLQDDGGAPDGAGAHAHGEDAAAVIDRVARIDPRIRRISAPGAGAARARNIGALEAARGDLLHFLEPGDIWAPDRLAAVARRFADADRPDVVIGDIRPAPRPGDAGPRRSPLRPEKMPGVLDALAGDPALALSNIALRRRLFRETGGFVSRLPAGETTEWLVRLLFAAPTVAISASARAALRPRAPLRRAALAAEMEGWAEAVETARIFGVAPDEDALARAEEARRRRLSGARPAACAVAEAGGGRFGVALRLAAAGLLRAPVPRGPELRESR